MDLSSLREFFPEVPPTSWESMARYCELLDAEGRRAGLIGFDSPAIPEQVARSLLVLRITEPAQLLIDVGSGAGLPGVPLAITGSTVVLVEPRQRAQAFLELVGRELQLNFEVIATTAEQVGRGALRETAQVVVARALARTGVALELCSPLCSPGGSIILSAGPDTEVAEPGVLEELGLGGPEVVDVPGPENIHQFFHIVQKVRPVGEGYPRRQGLAQRKPLS